MLEYRKMTQEELHTCSLLAAKAFYDYEYFSIFVPHDKRRQHFLNALIRCEFQANFRKSTVNYITAWENGRIVAVAQLCTPYFKKPSDFDYIKAGYLNAAFKGGFRTTAAWVEMDRKASAPCHKLGEKNWYLSLLTVAKPDEGRGIGSCFLNEYIIPYVKAAGGEIISLFTNSEINCKFYEKNGFFLFDKKQFEYGGKTIGSWSYKMKL